MVTRLATSARNAAAGAVAALVDVGTGGRIELRTGAQPATPNTVATGTLLVTIPLVKPAFGAAAAGTATGADPAAANGVAAGDAGYFRVLDSAGAAVYDGSVTATGGGGDMTLSTITVSVGLSVDLTALSYTQPL